MLISGLKRKLCRDLLVHVDATEFGSVVVTSFSYPNGESINLYFTDFDNETISVSDEGATTAFLRNQGIELPPERREIIKTICEPHDVEFVTPALRRQFQMPQIGEACMAICEAIIGVASIFYSSLSPARSSLPVAVDRLMRVRVEPKRGVERAWINRRHDHKGSFPVDFHLNGIGKPRDVFSVTSSSKAIMVVAVVNFLKSHRAKSPTLAIIDPKANLGARDLDRLQVTADELLVGLEGHEDKIVKFALAKR
jgi:hypothetical protein